VGAVEHCRLYSKFYTCIYDWFSITLLCLAGLSLEESSRGPDCIVVKILMNLTNLVFRHIVESGNYFK